MSHTTPHCRNIKTATTDAPIQNGGKGSMSWHKLKVQNAVPRRYNGKNPPTSVVQRSAVLPVAALTYFKGCMPRSGSKRADRCQNTACNQRNRHRGTKEFATAKQMPSSRCIFQVQLASGRSHIVCHRVVGVVQAHAAQCADGIPAISSVAGGHDRGGSWVADLRQSRTSWYVNWSTPC